MAAKFVHLHVHSHYSLLNALPKIPELVARAKAEGCEALALTDLGNLYGAIEFYKECKKAGIKPIIGVDVLLKSGNRLILLAENNVGYKNLLSLITNANLSDHEGKATITPEELGIHREGLIALVPRVQGEKSAAYKKIFDTHNWYEGVALHEIYYIEPSDRRAWETVKAIESGQAPDGEIDDADIDYSFPTSQEMENEFSKDALKETLEIAQRSNVELTLGSWVFPNYPIPKGSTYEKELKKIVEAGLLTRGLQATAEVRTRIDYELNIIDKKGFAPYFLVVGDLIRYAREKKILTTIRGSVAGSMVTYLAGITNVNPLEYKLPFERFLYPERPSAPDIDMDFADNRRDEVIDYARHKYGGDRVAQVGTFGTMLARGVVRDVARALGYAYGVGDAIARAIPMGSQGFPMTLRRALKESSDLAKMYKSDTQAKEVIELGQKIEGNARHISVHAAGVVIAPEALQHYTPLQLDPKSTNKENGKIITQYDMYSVEDIGLLKFDFLGIRNLAILAYSVELVEKTRGKKIDIENVPLDDKQTFEMLARGETEATFQLNGAGMTRYLKELRPTTIHDINAMVALFRPGPMESIPAYIERKHNPARISYLDPRMKDILDRSYGVITYQDDVLMIAIRLAGYSWLEADALRKAMGKKIPVEMEAQREKLVAGAIKNGMTKEKAEQLWRLIEPFAAYGFNKAHAASYGKVAYQTAYMKAHFPVEYMAAVLTAEAGNIDTVSIMVKECKRMGLPVLPPDVNESFGDFTVILSDVATKDSIRFGLYSIKNFGRGVADAIISERKANGHYVSLSDFLRRVKDQNLNKKGLESLIMCGALDSLGERGAMLSAIELLLGYHRDSIKEQSQDSLFLGLGGSVGDVHVPEAPPASMESRLAWEKELLGLYVSGHPLEKFRERLAKRPMTIKDLREKMAPGMTVVAGGMIEGIRTVLTRGGDTMAFIKIADFDGSIEAVIFPKNFTEYKDILRTESCIALKGRLSNRNGELSLVAEALKAL